MNWLSYIYNIGTEAARERKFMASESKRDIYNELNRELYKYIYRGSPHFMDDKIENYINQSYTYNSLVYSIINYMATTGAQVDWKLIDRRGDEVTEIYEHEFLDFWNEPNKDQTISEFIEAGLLYKYATGNTVIYAPTLDNGLNRGKLVKMEVMPSHVCIPKYGDPTEPIQGWVVNGQNWNREIDNDDVLHIKYHNPDVQSESPAMGMSPLKALVKVISQNNDAWTQLSASFQNGGPAGLFSKDGTSMDGDFTEQQGRELLDRLRADNSGPHKANTLAATGGNVKYTQIGLSPVDLNILESIKVSFIQICNAFKFPANLLNLESTMTYNNYIEAQKILWNNTLKQDLKIIGQKVSRRYLPAYGEGLELVPDYSKIDALQKDRAQMAQWLAQAWWIKGNRKQEIMGEDVDDEMDRYFIPAGLIEMDFLPPIEDVEDNLKRLKVNGY